MFSPLCRKLLIVAPSTARVYGTPKCLVAPRDAIFIRLFSSKKLKFPEIKGDEKQSFTVSYLINSCGLSSEDAISASKKLHLNFPEKPDLLLALLKSHGFGDSQITKIVVKIPDILRADPELTILPKLQFFHSIGVPAPVLAKVVSASPNILKHSLENSIIPAYNILKTLLETNERIVHFVKRTASSYHFIYGVLKYTHPNVEMLRKYGVRESIISSLATNYPRALILESDRLAKLVDRIIGLGLDAKKIIFVHAVQVLLGMSKSTWEHKKEVYKRWGWSESDTHTAFSTYPLCTALSEKNIMSTMEFLVNEMSCQPSGIAGCPIVISYNLEKRIRPRCRVVKVLMLKKLIKKPCSLSAMLAISDRLFLDRYVMKYQEKAPLLDVYAGNLDLEDLGFSSCEQSKVKLFYKC